MNKITPEKRAEIRAAAEKATKGPWECYKDVTEGKWFDIRNKDVKIVSPHAHKGCEDDFNFIALTDPDTVIALLNALDSAEKKLENTTKCNTKGCDGIINTSYCSKCLRDWES